jgi:two-component system OmpR family sensor kinase
VGLRARFVLLAIGLVLTVGAIVGTTAYVALRRSLHAQAAAQAAGQATRLAALVDVPGQSEQGQNHVDLADRSLSRDFPVAGLLVEIDGRDDRPLQASRRGLRLPLPAAARGRCATQGRSGGRLERPRVAFACRRLGGPRLRLGSVVVGVPLRSADRALGTLRRALVLGLAAGTLAAAMVALALAHHVLRPARQIAAAARSIREGDLSRRIGYTGARDELGTLAGELDACFAALQEALRRQRDFVADASHELKTPVAAMRAHVELLRGWAATDAASRGRALEALDHAARRAGRLVADLLVLADLDRPATAPRAPVALDQVVVDVIRECGPLRADVTVRVTRLDEAMVLGDELRLQQLLINLLDNALRAGPPGGEVRLALTRSGGEAIVTVDDDGPGIPPELLPHVFDRFVSADRRVRRHGAGSGLGLAIALAIARSHGGRLEAANGASGGAALRFTVPVAGPSSNLHHRLTDASSPAPSVDAQSTTTQRGGRT